jgi:glutaredoxin 3
MSYLRKSPPRKSKSPRRDRQLWTREETNLLINCVNLYGKKWAYIHKNYPLFQSKDRTQIDLKDKYRNLENGQYKYTIYTLDSCPSCYKAKELLKKKNLTYKEIPVKYEDKDKIFKKLAEKTNNYKYFPIIFHKKKFVGGFVDLEKEIC